MEISIHKQRYNNSQSNQVLYMFATQIPMRETVQLKSLPKRAISPPQIVLPQTNYMSDPFRKMEIKQSYVNDKLKCSIMSDNSYNTMIYEWRKVEQSPIVRVVEVARMGEINSLTGISCIHKTIKPEHIQSYLSAFSQFCKEQLLMILKNMLDGHQAILKKLKATSVSLDKSVITVQGEVKVWVNQQLERNDISGEILSKQQEIVQRIFETITFLSNNNNGNNINDFIQYVNSSMKRNGKWTFSYVRALIKSYSDCLKMKLPKSINKNSQEDKKYIQYSLIQNANEAQNAEPLTKRTRKASFGNRNTQSNLNWSQALRRQSQTCKSSQQNLVSLNNFFISPTSKSINQKVQRNTSETLKTLNLRTRHTSSFSGLIPQQFDKDTILQCSRTSNTPKSNIICEGRGSLKQSRKITSIKEGLLFNKVAITSLPEVQDEQCYTPSGKKSQEISSLSKVKKFNISQQFDVKFEKIGYTLKPEKNSSISTTNQTSVSGDQFCFAKKIKESHLTINLQDKENRNINEEIRTASKDRFNYKVNHIQEPRKAMVSCTNWSNKINNFDLKNFNLTKVSSIVQTKQEELEDNSFRQSNKLDIEKQVFSYKNLQELVPKQASINPVKSSTDLLSKYLKNPLMLFNELKSQQEIESYYKTDKNSDEAPGSSNTLSRKNIPEQILELLNLNKRLVISTYMQSGSEKKITEDQHKKKKSRKLREFEETIQQLMGANEKQEQIISGNCWTKTLENLLGLEEQELKQSISIGVGVEEANALIRGLKLSKLGRCGRDIGKSVIPE